MGAVRLAAARPIWCGTEMPNSVYIFGGTKKPIRVLKIPCPARKGIGIKCPLLSGACRKVSENQRPTDSIHQ